MESRRPGEGAAPGAVGSEEPGGLPKDFGGGRLQDLAPGGAEKQTEEDEAPSNARSGSRNRGGAGRDNEEAGTAEVHRKDRGRRPAGEVRTASRPRRGAACMRNVAVQGLRGRRRHVPRM